MDARTQEREHTPPAAPAPVPAAPPPMFAADGPLTARDVDDRDRSQRLLLPRPRPRPIGERSPEERQAKARRDLAALRRGIAKRLAMGVDPFSVSGARRKAGELAALIAELEIRIAPEQIGHADERIPPGEQLQLAPGPMAPPERAPTPAACVFPLPAAGDAEQVLRRPDGGFVYSFHFHINHGEPEKAWRMVDATLAANPGTFDLGPEIAALAQLSAAGLMTHERV